MYQGHMNDGSSVQKHSAGSVYPFVVYAQQTSWGLGWGVQGQGYDSGPCFCYESGAFSRAQALLQEHLRKADRRATERRMHADPMIRMATELLGCVWAPDVKGIPIIHTRRVSADRKAERVFWARKYCEDNQDLPMAAVAEGLRMKGYSRHEVNTALTAYVMDAA